MRKLTGREFQTRRAAAEKEWPPKVGRRVKGTGIENRKNVYFPIRGGKGARGSLVGHVPGPEHAFYNTEYRLTGVRLNILTKYGGEKSNIFIYYTV